MDNVYDPDFASFVRRERGMARWWLCPYGEWTEYSGSRVIFDRAYRPVCRIATDETVEIVPSDELICFREQRWFHQGFSRGRPTPEVRTIVSDIIDRYGLASELNLRWSLLRSRKRRRWPR